MCQWVGFGEWRGRGGSKGKLKKGEKGTHNCIVGRVTSLVLESCPLGFFSDSLACFLTGQRKTRRCRATNFVRRYIGLPCLFVLSRPLFYFSSPHEPIGNWPHRRLVLFFICKTRTLPRRTVFLARRQRQVYLLLFLYGHVFPFFWFFGFWFRFFLFACFFVWFSLFEDPLDFLLVPAVYKCMRAAGAGSSAVSGVRFAVLDLAGRSAMAPGVVGEGGGVPGRGGDRG